MATVTATQGGSTAAGMALRVFVLTSAAATQNGAASNSQFTNATTFSQAITTTQAGSRVYGASYHSPNTASTAAALTTVTDDIADATNNERYVFHKATSLTGTPGATTLGYTCSSSSGPFAQFEVKTAGTLTEDASGPAAVSTLTLTAVTTASFTPPAGSLLIALVASDGGLAVTTMALSDTSGLGLSWTEQAVNNPSGGDYAGVWLAQVPASGPAGKAPPGARMVYRRDPRKITSSAGAGRTLAIGAGQQGGPNAVTVSGTPQPPQYAMLGRPSRLAETYRMVP
jgi:hypothetical protein